MKKLLSVAVLASVLASGLFAQTPSFQADELTGDTRLACEAILCLSSGEKPHECDPSIKRYFSIKAKKWKDTVNARRNFLKLCPVGDDGENDSEFRKLRDDILVNVSDPCDLNTLNSMVEYSEDKNYNCHWDRDGESEICEYGVRISPKLPKSCQLLGSSKYTNVKPKYVCNGNFIPESDWRKGNTQRQISKQEYDKLYAQNPKSVSVTAPKGMSSNNKYFNAFAKYYAVEKVNKQCWVFE